MLKHTLIVTAAVMTIAAGAHAQSNDIANGNMHFDAKAMDTNRDQMISRDEFMKYGETLWGMMSKGADTLAVHDAALDFARGNMRFSAKAMDADHDGTITKDEFMKYSERKFDKMKDGNGMISVSDATKDFARGNMHPDSASKGAKPAPSSDK